MSTLRIMPAIYCVLTVYRYSSKCISYTEIFNAKTNSMRSVLLLILFKDTGGLIIYQIIGKTQTQQS